MGKYRYDEEEMFKRFGSHLKRKDFQILHMAQRFASDVEIYTANCSKNFRSGTVGKIRDYSHELIHLLRDANTKHLGTYKRKEVQDSISEKIDQIYDLLPVIKMNRIISPGQEGQLELKLCNLRAVFMFWIQSDNDRLFKDTKKITEELIKNTLEAAERFKQIDFTKCLSLLERILDPRGCGEDIYHLAGAIYRIKEENFPIEEFFLMNVSENNRFVFCNKQWNKIFALRIIPEESIAVEYRDERGFFYEADKISSAIKKYKYGKK